VSPPPLARWILARLLDRDRHEALTGDLDELFARRQAADPRAARRWYWRQVAAAIRDAADRRRHARRPPASGDPMLLSFLGALRIAARTLAAQPAFTAVAVVTLALGIGANATVFSWVNAVLVDPLPGSTRSGDLLEFAFVRAGENSRSVSVTEYRELQRAVPAIAGLAARDDIALGLAAGTRTSRVWAEVVSSNYFDVLGVAPIVGRTLRSDDERPGAPLVAVLAETTWRTLFNADPAIVGAVVRLNGQPATIVGVTPRAFLGGESGLRYDLWVPMALYRHLDGGTARLEMRGFRWLALRGRLAADSSAAQANAQADALLQTWRQQDPMYAEERGVTFYGLAMSDDGATGVMRTALVALAAVAGIVLLIACANLANLMLGRAALRRREMAIRRSLGATRARLMTEMLAEGLLLAVAGGAGAFLTLQWTAGLLIMFAPPSELPIALEVGIDARVVAFTAAVAMGSVLIFALLPAVQAAASTDMQRILRDGGGVVSGRSACGAGSSSRRSRSRWCCSSRRAC
jgi:predicted permease